MKKKKSLYQISMSFDRKSTHYFIKFGCAIHPVWKIKKMMSKSRENDRDLFDELPNLFVIYVAHQIK